LCAIPPGGALVTQGAVPAPASDSTGDGGCLSPVSAVSTGRVFRGAVAGPRPEYSRSPGQGTSWRKENPDGTGAGHAAGARFPGHYPSCRIRLYRRRRGLPAMRSGINAPCGPMATSPALAPRIPGPRGRARPGAKKNPAGTDAGHAGGATKPHRPPLYGRRPGPCGLLPRTNHGLAADGLDSVDVRGVRHGRSQAHARDAGSSPTTMWRTCSIWVRHARLVST
jgi:hypothetical protein